jgi:hypothetical protein
MKRRLFHVLFLQPTIPCAIPHFLIPLTKHSLREKPMPQHTPKCERTCD